MTKLFAYCLSDQVEVSSSSSSIREFQKTCGTEEMVADKKEEKPSEPAYSWSQGHGDVTVVFELPEGTKKEDIICVIKVDHMKIVISDGTTLLNGLLFAKVDTDGSTWTLEGRRFV